jgi:hypothetical protein
MCIHLLTFNMFSRGDAIIDFSVILITAIDN